jgi:hypothetical protein
VRREELGLSVGQFLVVPASKSPALLETGEAQAAQCHRPHIHLLQAVSEYTQSSSEKYPTIPLVDSPTDTPSAGNRMNSHHQTVATKRQVTMLPATPTFSTLPRRASKLEIARETAKVELRSMWPGVIADGLNPSSMRECEPIRTLPPVTLAHGFPQVPSPLLRKASVRTRGRKRNDTPSRISYENAPTAKFKSMPRTSQLSPSSPRSPATGRIVLCPLSRRLRSLPLWCLVRPLDRPGQIRYPSPRLPSRWILSTE